MNKQNIPQSRDNFTQNHSVFNRYSAAKTGSNFKTGNGNINVKISEYPKVLTSVFVKDHPIDNLRKELTDTEKRIRHSIFRGLIALIRSEDFNRHAPLADQIKINFETPNFSRSNNFGMLDPDDLYDLGVCAVPNKILNLIVCSRLANVHGDDLKLCSGFLKVGESWILDVSEKLAPRGALLPLRDRNNLIYGLKVFRYPDDQKPFFLKVRRAN